VDHAVQLMTLLAGGIEVVKRPEVGVFLGGDRPLFREVIGDACRGSEIQILQTVVCRVENRIDDQIPGMEVPTYDRSHFRRKAILVPMVGVDTELEIGAVEECPIVGVRHGKQRAQLESSRPPFPSLPALYNGMYSPA